MPDMELSEEEYDDDEKRADDELPAHEKENRSRYFFAVMCVLIALILLSFYLNNHFDFGPSLLLLLLVFIFGYLGVLFFRRKSSLNLNVGSWLDNENKVDEKAGIESEETGEVLEESEGDGQIAIEQLVEEALASIPDEFHEQMENVLVRVESEPGEDVLMRVGVTGPHQVAAGLGAYRSNCDADALNKSLIQQPGRFAQCEPNLLRRIGL